MTSQVSEGLEEFLVFGSPRIEEQSIEQVANVLHSGWLGSGPKCFVGLHDHPFYEQQFGLKRTDYPHSAFVTDRTFSIPLSSKLTDRQVDTVIGALRDVLG